MDSIVSNSEYPDCFTVSNDGSFFGYAGNGKFITRSTTDFRILHSGIFDKMAKLIDINLYNLD